MKSFVICWISILVLASQNNAFTNYQPLVDSLIKIQHYQEALELTDRLLFFSDQESKNELILLKSKIQIKLELPLEAYGTLDEIISNPTTDHKTFSQSIIYSAIAFIQKEEYQTALYFLETRPLEENWKNIRNILAAYCYYMENDRKNSKIQLGYSGIDKTEELFYNKKLRKLETKRNVNLAISYIFPGYVYLIKKNVGHAVSAVSVNSLLLYWTVTTAIFSPIDALLFTMPLSMRYYFGTQVRSEKIFDSEINDLKRKHFYQFYQKYKVI